MIDVLGTHDSGLVGSDGVLLALMCGLVLGAIGAVWSKHLPFGVVIGGALMCSMLTAGFMGTVIPMISKRLGFDPAATAGAVRDGVPGCDRICRVPVAREPFRSMDQMRMQLQ